MNKKIKASLAISTVLFVWWAVLFFSHTKEEPVNYWWQAVLAVAAITFGVFGLLTSKKWGLLKSGVGQGVFFISLGLIMWGVGQAGWTYYVIKYPGEEVPTATILDILYFSTIPLWTIGILRLSKATGAKYGLRSVKGKLLAVVVSAIMFVVSYYFLVVVARGGNEYFQQPFIDTFWDLGYAVGDAINLTLALVIFGLSWKLLGGKFRKPILVILAGFGITYLADFAFSYYDGKGLYYNGDKSDLLYLLMLTTFAVGLSMFDPSRKSAKQPVVATALPEQAAAPVAVSTPEVPVATDQPAPASPTPAQPPVVEQPQTPQPVAPEPVAVTLPTANTIIAPQASPQVAAETAVTEPPEQAEQAPVPAAQPEAMPTPVTPPQPEVPPVQVNQNNTEPQ